MRLLLPFLLLAVAQTASATGAYYRQPALHGDQVVFVAEGDLWSVPVSGGQATRLTTHPAQETQPAVSPDGRELAFVASYGGDEEVHVMPMSGGQPRQLSFDGGRIALQGYMPGGELVYATDSVVGPSGRRVLRVLDPATGESRDLPLADANEASFDSSGKRLWFTRFGLHVSGDNALDYRGGAMAQLYRFNLGADQEATRLAPNWNANQSRPMWWQGRVYLLADADGRPNLWSLPESGGDPVALTRHTDFDVRSPSLDQGRIVYQHGADLRLYDIASGQDRKIDIQLVSDFEQRQPRWLKKPLDYLESAHMSPAGDAVVVSARGKVAIASTGSRRRIDIAGPADARLREAVLSQDGKQVLAIQDHDGLSEIWSYSADGSSPGQRLVADSGEHRWRLYLSPDGRWLAHTAKGGRLGLLELASGKNRLLERAEHDRDDPYSAVVWSSDSRYLALARPDSAQQRHQIVLIEVGSGRKTTVTSNRYESYSPAFSADGQWLYFLSNRNFEPTPSSPWGDRNTGPMFDRRARIYALALQPGLRFPFAPRDELMPTAKEDTDAKADVTKDLPAIAFDGLTDRLFEVPVPAANYQQLAVHPERLYVLDQDARPGSKARLSVLAIDAEAPKLALLAEGVADFSLTADRKRLFLARQGDAGNIGELLLLDAPEKLPETLDQAQVRIADWSVQINPVAEWRQMFADAWRMHRSFSFDPGMRGQDWPAIRQRFETLLPRLADRADLDDLLAQMMAEHGILHSQVRGSELRADPDAPTPSALGAAMRIAADGVYIEHIYRTDPELPSERAPLLQPGVDAREGDRIVAVNGRALASRADLAAALQQQAGQQVLLQLSRKGAAAHRTVVRPIDLDREAQLRYLDWVQGTRDAVEQTGQGRIGYLHLRAMGPGDIASFVRDFYAQFDREGLIIDVRRNRGGNIDSWIIEKLLRRTWAYWDPVDAAPYWNQQQSFRGHLVVLADQFTYSDGETFAAGIKALKLGPVIGMRTAGAGIWLSDRNRLLDKGLARVAEYAQYDRQGRWLIEGTGVAPDIEVDNPPHATALGADAQLAAALQYLADKLKAEPVIQPDSQPIPPRGKPAHDGS
ncbi:MAG: S41 family peptidase [Lysobacterales bacterium]